MHALPADSAVGAYSQSLLPWLVTPGSTLCVACRPELMLFGRKTPQSVCSMAAGLATAPSRAARNRPAAGPAAATAAAPVSPGTVPRTGAVAPRGPGWSAAGRGSVAAGAARSAGTAAVPAVGVVRRAVAAAARAVAASRVRGRRLISGPPHELSVTVTALVPGVTVTVWVPASYVPPCT